MHMFRKVLGCGAAVTAALLLWAAPTQAGGHGGGGHGGGGHGGGGFHSSGGHGGGGFHSSGFNSGFHSSGFHNGFHDGGFHNGFHDGFHHGFHDGFHHSFHDGFHHGFHHRFDFDDRFRFNPFFFGFGSPFWGGYYPYYGGGYYPGYNSYSSYYDPYYAYSYPTTVYAPAVNYQIIDPSTTTMPYSDGVSDGPPPRTRPRGPGYTPSPDGTYPYDGGPRNPVPMPKEATDPTATPPSSSVPQEGRTVSRTVAKSKYTFAAYGEGSVSVAGAKTPASPNKQTVKKTDGD
jgi:hypothetical protein